MRTRTQNLALTVILGLLATTAHAGVGGGPFVSGMMRGLSANEVVTDAVVLPSGDLALCGWIEEQQVWDNAPGWRHSALGGTEAFVAIVTSDLSKVKSYTLLGGKSDDKATAIAASSDGRVFVVGYTESTDFPTTSGTIDPLYNSYVDGFLACFNADLTELKLATYIGGSGNDYPYDVMIDDLQTIFICGSTSSASGFPTNNGLYKTLVGNSDAFVMRLSPNAATVQFSTYFGGSSNDSFTAMALDNSGTVILTGSTSSADFPMFPAINTTWWWYYKERPYDWTYNEGNSDAVLTVLSQDGARAISSTYFGGGGVDEGVGVANIDGTIYLLGTTASADMPTLSGLQAQRRGKSDMFLAAFKDNGRTLTASTYFGGTGEDEAVSLSVYRKTSLLITGNSNSTDFPSRGFLSAEDTRGGWDGVIVIGGPSNYQFATTFGGPGNEALVSGVAQADGGVIVVGGTESSTIELSSTTLTGKGAFGATDAVALQIERGGIDLGVPFGGERFCEGALVRVSWATTEMEDGDTYTIEVSTDQKTWLVVADKVQGTRYDWTISSATTPLERSYYVRVRSSRGHTTRTASSVRLDPAPKITQQPDATVVLCPGDEHTIAATVEGDEITYQWLRNSAEIGGATEPTLTLNESAQPGTYTLRYRTACGSTGTTTPCVVSKGLATTITQQPKADTVREGEPIRLSVSAKGTNLTYQWFKDGSEIPGQTTAEYTIQRAGLDASATYSCKVTGTCGTVESTQASVLVQPALGVAESDDSSQMLYPNPAKSTVTLCLSATMHATTVIAFNTVGQVVHQWHLNTGTPCHTLSVQTLSAGTYRLVVSEHPELGWNLVVQE